MKVLTNTALVMLGLGVMLSSCSKKQQSQKTGLAYNDRTNGGYLRFTTKPPFAGPGPGTY
jgi:sulfatase modifying factor 1